MYRTIIDYYKKERIKVSPGSKIWEVLVHKSLGTVSCEVGYTIWSGPIKSYSCRYNYILNTPLSRRT